MVFFDFVALTLGMPGIKQVFFNPQLNTFENIEKVI